MRRLTGNCHATTFSSSRMKSCLAHCFIVHPVAGSGVYSAVVDPSSITPAFLFLLTQSLPHIIYPHAASSSSSTSYSCIRLASAWSSICVLDAAFLDGSVRACRETPLVLAWPPVSRFLPGVWQLSAPAWVWHSCLSSCITTLTRKNLV